MIELPELSDEPLGVRTMYPDPEYYNGWDEAIEECEETVKETVNDAEIIGVTHTDADGYGCEVMLREAYPDKRVRVVTAAEGGPLKVEAVGKFVERYAPQSARVFIMDLCPNENNSRNFIKAFSDFQQVHVIDHHTWSDVARRTVNTVASLHLDEEKCATQITCDLLVSDPSDSLADLADLTADHDLWLKERREDSDALADLAAEADREEYVSLCKQFGSGVVSESPRARTLIDEKQERRERKTQLALNRTTTTEIAGYSVSISYGSCDPSHTGEVLYDERGIDLAVILYPNGKLSLRSHEDTPIAGPVASELGGGGHPCAAGCSIRRFVRNDIGYHAHWSTKGRAARTHIEEQLNNILPNLDN